MKLAYATFGATPLPQTGFACIPGYKWYFQTMSLALQIKKMTRLEKLKAMEDLWADLSRDDSKVKSPAWHETALKETDQALKVGKLKFTDWELAKKQLRASLA